ncbi:kinetochore CENP-C fungal-like protein [Chaetomium sp. MPI-SDFR-AT-0129]|nr:kinetochore CENP-C fungal-like protein [Chaetomium sp. MPI-SDFR-AT-0129]
MAPRLSLARRTLAPQGEHIYELGVVGRKTGVTVPDSGVRDEHGMEPIENLFSSPGKSDQEENQENSDDYGSGEEAMDITTTSGIGPAALLKSQGNRLPVPLSRVRSPAKTLLNSPAQRNRFLARNSSSPARGSVIRNDGSRSSSQPTGDSTAAATKRRLDFRSVANGGPHSLSQPQSLSHHRMQPLQHEDEEEAEVLNGADEYGADEDNDDVNDFVEESMAMLNGADDDDLGEPGLDAPQEEESVGEVDPPTPVAAKKKPGRPPKKQATVSAKIAAVQRKPAPAVLEEQGDADDQEDDGQPEDEEEQEPTPEQARPAPGRRGRPAKTTKPPAATAPAPSARGAKKRRSLEGPTETEPDQPDPKRQRTSPAGAAETKKRGRPPKSATAESSAAAAAKPKPRGRGRKPSPDADVGDTSHISIARRPPLPKSRGLLINRPVASRHEHLDDPNSSMRRTRSGRTSFKPLAYWRNERVEFDRGEAEDTFVGRKKTGRFVLPSVSGIVRVDEPEVDVKRAGAGRRGRRKSTAAAAAGGKSGRRRRSGAAGYDGDDYDDDSGAHGPAEVWELDPGTVTGEVVVWQPEYEFSPPAPNDIINVIDKQLAISSAAIKTTEVVGGEFRYAKVFSEGFIGAGVVDLPPGAVKRLKNSRKVFMIFFVHAGRVLVTVQETSFRISRGGIFIVPRYNEYTIENDYDHPARIFFAQGQEVAVNPPDEQDGGAEGEEDADEEVEVSEGGEGEEEEGSEEE